MIDFKVFEGFDYGQTERQMNLISFSAGIGEMKNGNHKMICNGTLYREIYR